MGIGYRELIVLVVIMVLLVVGIVGLVRAASRPPKVNARSAADRLAELEALRRAEQITDAQYERQRAAIVSSI